MTDTWFILPSGKVVQPLTIPKDSFFLWYRGKNGKTSPGHYMNEEHFEQIAREFPCSYGSYKCLQDLVDKIEIEGGFEYFFIHYTGEDFENTPIKKEVKEYRLACIALENKFAKLKKDENLTDY